ncbi:MAG: hypothetical protein ABIR46_03070 [Candidatus Saccharimonadales bacterium]
MTEIETEHQRYEEGKLGRDFLSMTPEAVWLRNLIDHLGEVAVLVATEDDVA